MQRRRKLWRGRNLRRSKRSLTRFARCFNEARAVLPLGGILVRATLCRLLARQLLRRRHPRSHPRRQGGLSLEGSSVDGEREQREVSILTRYGAGFHPIKRMFAF